MFLSHFICNVNCLACPDPHSEPIKFLKNTLINGRGIIDDVAGGSQYFCCGWKIEVVSKPSIGFKVKAGGMF